MKVVLSYRVAHEYEISDLLREFKRILQRAIDEIWEAAEWKEKRVKHRYRTPEGWKEYEAKRLIPYFPKGKEFKRKLRNELREGWPFTIHYVDSAIKTAYSILESWRKNYLKGLRRKKKPKIRREFVRVKTSLMKTGDGWIRISVRPREEFLFFDYSKEWFYEKVKGWKPGEVILKEGEAILTFSKEIDFGGEQKIGIDCNVLSLDIYSPERGWIKVDLRPLHRISEAYDRIIDGLMSLERKAPKRIGRLLKKYLKRKRDRIEDYLNKLAVQLSHEFPNAVFVFEDLEKLKMYRPGWNGFNRKLSRACWKKIVQKLSYRAEVIFVDPRGTSRTCPRCGGEMEPQEGQGLMRCPRCGFEADRQFLGALNVFLRGAGVPLSGAEGNDVPPDEPRGRTSPLRPKLLLGVDLSGRTFVSLPSRMLRRSRPQFLLRTTIPQVV